jgi:hypothetical protein
MRFEPRRRPRANLDDLMARTTARLQEKTGFQFTEDHKTIPDHETFREWCERLGKAGMLVDGKPFKLDDRPAMAWIYDQVPSTADEAYNFILVLMKCAQVGFTVLEMLACIYMGLKFGPATVGMFLPDINLAGMKSTERFMPVVRSIPDVHKLMTQDAPDGSGRKAGEGNVNRRRIDKALFVFSWTSGKASTESVPMDVVSYDEVQGMQLEQLEKTQERLSASAIRFTLMGSTANWPDEDIHHWYKKGSQHQFHTECPTCGVRKPLDDYFPDCIAWDAARRAYHYVCQAGHRIDDTQRGEWIAQNPDADLPIDRSLPKKDWPKRIRSIHFPQFLSPTISASDIMTAYNEATDLKNFHNRKLGKPFLDPTVTPVTMEHCARAVELGRAAGVVWKERARNTFMGIDQMGKFNVHLIMERLPDGRQAVIYVEETYSDDPFMRSSELMEQFGVQCCVVEINPNYNDAHRFAKRHLGKVFLCNGFGALDGDMVVWGDAPKVDASDRRTAEDTRSRYVVKADQYKCMQASLARIVQGTCLFPDPQGLVQEVVDKGVKQMAAVLPRAFLHFTKTALVAEKDKETNKFKRAVKKIGIDPHFSYSLQLAGVAWARAHGTASFILPQEKTVDEERREAALAANMPGMPAHVMAAMEKAVGGTCGACTAFPMNDDGTMPPRGVCGERGCIVQASDPGCDMFVEAAS